MHFTNVLIDFFLNTIYFIFVFNLYLIYFSLSLYFIYFSSINIFYLYLITFLSDYYYCEIYSKRWPPSRILH